MFVLVGSNPTAVTNVNVVPALVVRTEVVAEMSRRSRRDEVGERGSLEAVVSADVSRAEFFVGI